MIKSCKSCQFCGFDQKDNAIGQDICGIDGKNVKNQAWQACDRHLRCPGADEHEDTIEAEIIELCAGEDMVGVEIEIDYWS